MTAKVFLSHQLGKSKIIIDGNDITEYVRAIEISQWGCDLPSIKLDMYIPECEIQVDTTGEVEISSVEISQRIKYKIEEKITDDYIENYNRAKKVIYDNEN